MSVARQCELLDISRSGIYRKPAIDVEDIRIMRVIDEIYTACPFYGSRRIRWVLAKANDIHICREHVQRLMRLIGLQAIYPRPRSYASDPNDKHRKYPYLLRNLAIIRPNQVWGTDITYIRLNQGFAYLVALLDWFSRYVISWQLSETLEIDFCVNNLEQGLRLAIPEIHNSDQGSNFTSRQYTDILTNKDIQISMDGRGRCMDNIFTERFWRTVKYECLYLNAHETIDEARKDLDSYFRFYNNERPHQSQGYRTPAEVYFGKSAKNDLLN